MAPLIVTTEPGLRVTAAQLVRQSGWLLVHHVPTTPWDLVPQRVVLDVDGPGPAAPEALVEAAARGAGVVVACSAEEAPGVFDDLRRVGRVELWTGSDHPTAADLSPEQAELLGQLAGGGTLGGAAAGLFISRRTADRRLAEAKSVLGVGSTAEALLVVGTLLKRLAD